MLDSPPYKSRLGIRKASQKQNHHVMLHPHQLKKSPPQANMFTAVACMVYAEP
jgi:hypothetical protein